MLVAEKRQYMEPYDPRVLGKEKPVSTPQPRIVPKSKSKPQTKVLPIVIVLVGFAVCAYTVGGFATIAQKQQEILALEEILEKQQDIQEHLKIDLTASGDLQRIEEFAKNSLDMNYPDKEQVLFVKLPEQKIEDTTDTLMGMDQKESLWSKIVGLLD